MLLDGFSFHHMLRTPLDDDESPRVPAQLFAALTAAHAQLGSGGMVPGEEPAFAVAWDRPAKQRQIRVLVGGRPFFPPAGHPGPPVEALEGGFSPEVSVPTARAPFAQPLLYPPGSQAVPIASDQLGNEWAALRFWTRCPGQSDALWTRDPDTVPANQSVRGGFDDYIAHLPGAFAWLVVATPRKPDKVQQELMDLELSIPRLRARESSEPDRIALLRAEGRFRELSKARSSGVWEVHVLVGGQTEDATRSAAAVMCSASDLDNLPYVLTPGRQCTGLEETWHNTTNSKTSSEPGEPTSPFMGSSELLAAIARPPKRELPGIRLIEQPRFDVTPEHDGDIHLGSVLDDADLAVGDLKVELDTLNRHTFVAGATGSGKSQTVRHLLEGLHEKGVPWLVIEPAKAEYSGMAGRLGERGDVHVIRPGDPDAVPVGLNPLEPEPGFPLQTHLDLTRALFMAAFDAQEPFPQVLSHALTTCYTELGWDPVTGDAHTAGGRPKYPNLGDLQRVAMDVVENIGYGPEISQNVQGFIDVRIGSLRLGTPGRFFEGSNPIDIAELLRRNVVLEIEDIGNDTDKAFFIGAVLIRLFEHLRVRHEADPRRRGLVHVTVLEEAHRLLKRTADGSPTAHAVELFTSLLAEIRAYGEGIIVAEQIPSKIVPDVIKNTALKILHRLPAEDDRHTVGATMNLDEVQSRHVVTLPPGRAVIFADGMDRPIRLTVPLDETTEDPALARSFTHTTARPGSPWGSQNQQQAYTLRELNRTIRISDDHPELILWIELLVLAHVRGKPAPVPRTTWLRELEKRYEKKHLLELSITHRIRKSTDARYVGLAKHYRPEDLAEHIVTSVHSTLDGATNGCDGGEIAWQAGAYRWADVYRDLSGGDAGTDQQHPNTRIWADRGLMLAAPTAPEQLAELGAHPSTWQVDDRVVTGSGQPTALETATAKLSQASDPQRRFVEATSFLSAGPPLWAHHAFEVAKRWIAGSHEH